MRIKKIVRFRNRSQKLEFSTPINSRDHEFLSIGNNNPGSMTTQDSGNTIPSSRCFQITLNQVEFWEDILKYLLGRKMLDYGIACSEEAPTTGHKHIHCYVHFSDKTRLAISKMHGAHIEVCRGSPKQNIAYIRKDGNIIWEYGEEPHQGMARTIKELKEIKNEDEVPVMQYKTWKSLPRHSKKKDIYKPDIEVYYIWGESGKGKSKYVYDQLSDDDEFDRIKHINGFWHNVSEECKIAWYDEFRDSQMPASEFINFIDYYVNTMNTKGGSVLNNYKKIYITSIQSPYEIYKNWTDEEREQWLRRIKIIDLEEI